MTGRIRSHARESAATGWLLLAGGFGTLVSVICLLQVAVMAVNDVAGGFSRLWLVGVLIVGLAVRQGLLSRRERRARREMAQWLRTAGWEPAMRAWPWQGLVRWADTVTVLRAFRKRVEGFPVWVGELQFTDNGLGTAIDRRDGKATFAVVTLPRPAPSMGVRVHRHAPKLRDGYDFLHRFEPVGAATELLSDPELRAAFVRDDIPPWTLIEDELFLFLPLGAPLRPRELEEAARKAIRVVELLGLAVEIGEDR